jgi:hypothetical protein
MHKYTTEIISENNLARQNRNHYTLRHYFSEESSTSVCYFVVVVIFIYCCFNVVACRLYDMLVLFIFFLQIIQEN